jgi:hypothetical protein
MQPRPVINVNSDVAKVQCGLGFLRLWPIMLRSINGYYCGRPGVAVIANGGNR